MKKVYLIGFIMCAGIFVFAGLQAGQNKDLPEAEAEAFWTYITETDPYEQWDHFPGYKGLYQGEHPHGAYLKFYANEIAMEAARAGEPMPDGAILIKENYGEEKKLVEITPMYKKEGYNPDDGDWFWGKYEPDGTVDAAGKVEGCIQCHRAAPEDYIFSQPK